MKLVCISGGAGASDVIFRLALLLRPKAALLLAPTLCLLLSGFFERICARWGLAGRILLAPLDFAGRYSLEIYLLHERLALHFDGVYNQKTILLMTIVLAVLLHEAIRLCIVLIRKLASRPARARP